MTGVLLVGGSAASRRRLRQLLEAERDIEVVRELAETTAVLSVLSALGPRVVIIDESVLPGAGLVLIETIMAEAPLPILVMSELAPDPGDELLIQARRRGVLAVAAKPASCDLAEGAALRASVRRLANTAVVRHLRSLQSIPGPRPGSTPGLTQRPPLAGNPGRETVPVEVVGIGASAGGPAALAAILAELPQGFSACVLVVQHLSPGFAAPFAAFLQAHTQLPVSVASEPRPLTPGHVLLAPDRAHLIIQRRGLCAAVAGPLVNGHIPSVDQLLESLARVYRAGCVGVILSGIGTDGTAGLRAIREQGGLTIAQDGPSAAVNGMPRSAVDSGAAELVLTPPAIAQALLRACSVTRGGGSRGG